jgi:hypothetical protein
MSTVAMTEKAGAEAAPHVGHECDMTNQAAEMPPTGWFKALAGVELEYDTTKTRQPPHKTAWFKALKGVEQEYDNFRVDHRF